MSRSSLIDEQYLRIAARLAVRGHGGAEPNPLVGCVVVRGRNEIVGWGYHAKFGGPHAEIVALRRAGSRAQGATGFLTLEPCNHQGKTGPCTEALIAAGVARVVIARRDPNPIAAGGVERLKNAGVAVEVIDGIEDAIAASDPFAYRVRSGLPWVIAKWAQTIDGAIATRAGQSQWISSDASRRLLHRERGRVDAILTSVGTILADDPLLTARVRRPRRIARRVIIDPLLKTPLNARVIATASMVPTTILTVEASVTTNESVVNRLRQAGVEVIGLDSPGTEIALAPALRELSQKYAVSNVLLESGAGLLSRLFQQRLVREAWIFTGPLLLGDDQAKRCVGGMTIAKLTDGIGMELQTLRRRGDDIVARYRIKG